MDDVAPTSPNSPSESASETPATGDESSTIHVAKKRKGSTLEKNLWRPLIPIVFGKNKKRKQ